MKMNLEKYIQEVQLHLLSMHSKVLDWIDEQGDIRKYRPKDKSLENLKSNFDFDLTSIDEKGIHKSFKWDNNS